MNNRFVMIGLYAFAITGLGFAFTNMTFMFYTLTTNGVLLFLPANFQSTSRWFMPVMMTVDSLIVLSISWFVLRSKMNDFIKASFSIVPLAVVYLAIGIPLHRTPALALSISAVIFVALMVFLYKAKKSWFYYYAVSLISIALFIITIFGIDI